MLYAAAGVLALVIAFVWWRYTSVARGAAQRDRRVLQQLESLGERLERNEPVSADEVATLAGRPELRPILYAVLHEYELAHLFPPELLSVEEQARAQLAYWMMHPNELQDPPEEIETISTVRRPVAGREAEFVVLRYRMPAGHWAGNDWLLGLSGPFFPGAPPYENEASGFSRAGDKEHSLSPEALVEWYAGVLGDRFGNAPD